MREDLHIVPRAEGYQPFTLITCGKSYCDRTYRIVRPNAPLTVFEYVIRGTGTVCSRGGVFYPSEGDIYLLHQGDDHDYFSDADNPWTKVWFNISGELVRSVIAEYGLRDINHVHGLDLSEHFEEMISIASSELPVQELHNRAASVFLRVVCKISDHLRRDAANAPADAVYLREFINRSAEKKISLSDLSALINRSESQVTRIFKAAFGVTPYEYALQVKLETARVMLLGSNMKIGEISARLGFSDEHYFSNAFKKKVGMSPREFRASGTP